MRTSVLEIILEVDRVRRRAAPAGFSLPVLLEYTDDLKNAPFLSTNTRGVFLQTRLSREGVVRFAPTLCPPEQEGRLVEELVKTLWAISCREGWANRCSDLGEAQDVMLSLGETPKAVVVPPSVLEQACGEKMTIERAEHLMAMQGYIARTKEGLLVLSADLPEGRAFLASGTVGAYVRSHNHVGVLIRRADRSLVLVG